MAQGKPTQNYIAINIAIVLCSYTIGFNGPRHPMFFINTFSFVFQMEMTKSYTSLAFKVRLTYRLHL